MKKFIVAEIMTMDTPDISIMEAPLRGGYESMTDEIYDVAISQAKQYEEDTTILTQGDACIILARDFAIKFTIIDKYDDE